MLSLAVLAFIASTRDGRRALATLLGIVSAACMVLTALAQRYVAEIDDAERQPDAP